METLKNGQTYFKNLAVWTPYYFVSFFFSLKDRSQISLLIFWEFKRINELLGPLKSLGNYKFSDEFRENRSKLIRSQLHNISRISMFSSNTWNHWNKEENYYWIDNINLSSILFKNRHTCLKKFYRVHMSNNMY